MPLPQFDEPDVVAIVVAQGNGSKLFQSLLDNHPQIHMIPAYPLMYFYPHWDSWIKELGTDVKWNKLIELLCLKHASVIDSRRIKGHNGLGQLGSNKNEYVNIDENLFREYLAEILTDEPINSRTFLLAIHYAYSLCRGEILEQKKALVYHIHVAEYLVDYLIKDFPNVKVIGTTRDPRPNFERRCKAERNLDHSKLNQTDALIYKGRIYNQYCWYACNEQNKLSVIPNARIKLIRHEDLGIRRTQLMKDVINIPVLEKILSEPSKKLTAGNTIFGLYIFNRWLRTHSA